MGEFVALILWVAKFPSMPEHLGSGVLLSSFVWTRLPYPISRNKPRDLNPKAQNTKTLKP